MRVIVSFVLSLVFIIISIFFSGYYFSNKCFADGGNINNNIEPIFISEANFYDDFYANENLLGESGKNYCVVFNENIDLTYFVINDLFKKGLKFETIGTNEKPFTSQIFGNNKTISNLYVDLSESEDLNLALFGKVKTKISDLTFQSCSFFGNDNVATVCVDCVDAIFENVNLINCVLNGENVANFCLNSVDSFFSNINISIDEISSSAFLSSNKFEFAKSVLRGGINEFNFNNNTDKVFNETVVGTPWNVNNFNAKNNYFLSVIPAVNRANSSVLTNNNLEDNNSNLGINATKENNNGFKQNNKIIINFITLFGIIVIGFVGLVIKRLSKNIDKKNKCDTM